MTVGPLPEYKWDGGKSWIGQHSLVTAAGRAKYPILKEGNLHSVYILRIVIAYSYQVRVFCHGQPRYHITSHELRQNIEKSLLSSGWAFLSCNYRILCQVGHKHMILERLRGLVKRADVLHTESSCYTDEKVTCIKPAADTS